MQPFGCDEIFNSTARVDKCGVCKGAGDTCKEWGGSLQGDWKKFGELTLVIHQSRTVSFLDSGYGQLILETEADVFCGIRGDRMCMEKVHGRFKEQNCVISENRGIQEFSYIYMLLNHGRIRHHLENWLLELPL